MRYSKMFPLENDKADEGGGGGGGGVGGRKEMEERNG